MSNKGEDPMEGYDPNALPQTRSYQQEMLEQSLHRNIIIALDTGSGKTHIAVLRLKHEMERRTNKISWFFAPTVGLCEQQRSVIQRSLPVPVGLISGALEPDQWKDAALWMRVLRDHKIMISTPQVLLDALRHGYINLGRDISLLVFDEAHHAVDNHPYNRVMLEFYRPLATVPVNVESQIAPGKVVPLCRPAVLGLTASPIFGGNTEKAFRTIESNLDATICAPVVHRKELLSHVHRPTFKHVMYTPPGEWDRPFSTNLASLQAVVKSVDINRDPAVISLRQKLPTLARGTPEYERTDQRLSKAIHKKKTFTHTGLTQFQRAAEEICEDIGGWAADWYVWTVVQEARKAARIGNSIISLSSWGNKEKKYLLDILDRVHVNPVSLAPDDILDDSTEKVHALVNTLLSEKAEAEAANEAFSALVFVERRDSVFALAELLKNHPVAGREFSVGNLVGTSESTHRHSFLDITRVLLDQKLDETLEDFRLGTKNVIVSTSVAEEGIDIQACGCVVRWDPPPNMASWVQSRGRARRKRSVFVSLFSTEGGHRKDVNEWERLEKEMVDRYTDPTRVQYNQDAGWGEDGEDEDEEELIYTNPTTGAKITLQSALPHLEHFCAMIPFSAHTDNRPIYDVDPPEMPPGWHENTRVEVPLPTGPFGATVTLPRVVPLEVRSFTVPREFSTKISAFRHVAFVAYTTLHKCGLLNDHFLPFTTVIDPEREEEVREMLKDVEQRAGMANVTGQMDPWRPRNPGDLGWHGASLRIGLLRPLLLLTKNPQSEWTEQDGPRLHRKGEDSMIVTLRRLGRVDSVDDRVIRATEYTRRMFWAQSGARMNWDNTSFAYLLLPVNPPQSDIWERRRAWWRAHSSFDPQPSRQGLVNAQTFGRAFGYPNDIVLIRQGTDFGKTYRFVRWAHEPIDAEEEEKLRTRYETVDGYKGITYPILVVQPLPARVNFLAPLPPRASAAPTSDPRFVYLLPQFASVILQGQQDAEYAALLPSTLRALEVTTTVDSLKEHLFASTPMESVPQSLMSVAMTAPVSQEPVNYQRLETMGDTVLKYLVSIQLYAEYPLWHEGYLAKQKDHTVSNVRLAKISVRRHIFQWIIRDRLVGKKWKPKYCITVENASNPAGALEPSKEDGKKGEEDQVAPSVREKSTGTEVASEKNKPKKKKKKDNNQLSTKVLADVIESLIGAAYVHGGLSLGRACAQFFDLGLKWDTTSARISTILSRTVTLDQYPAELQYVERMLGYTFERKALLIEALTHASYQEPLPTPSYGRLEFLGDAVLDMAVTPYIFASKKNYSPGHIHLRRSAAVNMHFLAFVCLRAKVAVDKHMPRPTAPDWRVQMATESQDIYLWQCMLHSSSTVIDDQNNTFARFRRLEKEISEALETGDIFPWAALTRMQAPKFFSDVVESLIGAVFLDAEGDMEIATDVIRTLGIMRVLERVVDEDLDVLHPLSRLSVWAQQAHKELELISEKEKGKAVCRVLVDGEEIARDEDAYHGKVSLNEVKFTAAEKAVRVLKVREGDEKGRMMMGKRKSVRPDAKL
ncbi:P-loop containing nucleoside triphosphate hydrolase protein [Schizophyllum commune H4-8]|uniref:P-loop containing nucleoside triphosphate hydrolase protein n=1 Tax=Schizophyllum commune (strain H4-8 / FGSC 9210) TaxID=578458 RepID=UPI0021606ED8|nr:P-loop containing nucleoside triphosphate hydrolase protein [Schizophyllum commune H4-8]KAI5895582.1 P-loop containing nucleoside triphosphate hydrolase protein [Schizophyllum commune H4-8]